MGINRTGDDRGHVDRLIESVAIDCLVWYRRAVFTFDAVQKTWNTCPGSGPIRAASGDGSYMFLDDTASDLWLMNADRVLRSVRWRHWMSPGYQHAIELVDSSRRSVTYDNHGDRRPVWPAAFGIFDHFPYRSPDLGQCLMAAGMAYDSGAGRGFCAPA